MGKKYTADYSITEKCRRKKTSHVFSCIMSLILAILSVSAYSNSEMKLDLMKSFNADHSEIELYLLIFSIAFFIWAAIDLLILILYAKKLSALSSSFVSIDNDSVKGTTHRGDLDKGKSFHVTFDKITSASSNRSEEINLIIYTRVGTYRCLCIGNARSAAELINKRCAALKADAQIKNHAAAIKQAAAVAPIILICPKCNKAIPEGMQFCGICGSMGIIQQQQVVPAEKPSFVEPLCVDGLLTCPICGAKGQRPNRTVCLNCGVSFVKK